MSIIPDWYGFNVSLIEIKNWVKKYDDKCEIYNIFQNNINKYNL